MISAEEIKALMAKGCTFCCPECGNADFHKGIWNQGNEERVCTKCKQSWFADINYTGRFAIKALSTLQTLLNQAAEDVQKVIGDYKGLAAVCKANSLWRTHNDALETIAYLERRLAAIEPYLTKEGE